MNSKPMNVSTTPAATAPRVRTAEQQLEEATYEVNSARRALLENCTSAVERLESFAARCREELTRAQADIDGRTGWGEYVATKLPQRIAHEATWGLANALSEVETASSYATRYACARATLAALESLKAAAAAEPPACAPGCTHGAAWTNCRRLAS